MDVPEMLEVIRAAKEEIIALRARVAQLEEAVEWALQSIDIVHEAGISGKEFKDELRRRAGRGDG